MNDVHALLPRRRTGHPRFLARFQAPVQVSTLRERLHAANARATTGFAALIAVSIFSALSSPAHAVTVELKDVAPDRIERQRAASIGQIPLPNTPNIAQFTERLAEKKMTLGSAIFIRIFKAESELEIWMQRGEKFELFATYPICHWSGTLGPKLNEGDKQSPEGIYTVTSRQLHLIGRHPRSLNLGFPNALDRSFSRTGSYILVHGACSSVGCFAMTNPVITEIYALSQAALAKGQPAIQVQALPFRLTEERLRAHALSEWYDFWRNLKDAYDSFERTKLPPQVSVCEGRYWVDDAKPEEVASHGPLAVCGISRDIAGLPSAGPDSAAPPTPSPQAPSQDLQTYPQKQGAMALPLSPLRPQPLPLSLQPTLSLQQTLLISQSQPNQPPSLPTLELAETMPHRPLFMPSGRALVRRDQNGQPVFPQSPDQDPGQALRTPAQIAMMNRPNRSRDRLLALAANPSPTTTFQTTPLVQISCETSLASCRRHVSLQRRIAVKTLAARSRPVKVASRR